MYRRYSGTLGVFSYDTRQFRLITKEGKQSLNYIGVETDGNKIHIPEGLLNATAMFSNNSQLKIMPKLPNSLKIADYMFSGCCNLEQINFDFSENLQSVVGMFNCCSHIENIPRILYLRHNLDCANMFNCCKGLTSIDLTISLEEYVINSLNDIPNIILAETFCRCSCLKSVKLDLSEFRQIKNMSNAFRFCIKLKNVDIKFAKQTIDAKGLFFSCESLKEIPTLAPNIMYCNNMFAYCSSLTKINKPLPKMRDASYMFSNCDSLTDVNLDLGENIISADSMFSNCENLKTLNLGFRNNKQPLTVGTLVKHDYSLEKMIIVLPVNTRRVFGLYENTPFDKNQPLEKKREVYAVKGCKIKYDIHSITNLSKLNVPTDNASVEKEFYRFMIKEE